MLLIGRNRCAVDQLGSYSEKLVMSFDDSFACQRHFPEFDNYTIEYSKTNVSTLLGVPARVKEIIRWQRKYAVDVIYTNTKWDMLAAKIASYFIKGKIALISTSHNSYAWQNQKSVKMMSLLIRLTTDVFVSLASFVSEALLSNYVKRESLLLLPNTIDARPWAAKSDYSFRERFRIVYVAYVSPAKGQDFILKVLEKLADRLPIDVDIYGDIDGTPDYVESMKNEVVESNLYGRFNFCGRIENYELRERLMKYDLYLCPSQMEMSPVNILEAQAAGLPILAAKVGGITNLIDDNETGLLFEPGDVDFVAGMVETLFQDKELREKLGRAGCHYVRTVYTPAHAGEQLKNMVDDILKM